MALWAKLWTDILDDPKLIRAAREGAKHLVLLPWLIAFAKRANDNGRLTVNGQPAAPEDIARSIPAVSPRKVSRCFVELEAIGVLVSDEAGVLRLAAWDTRNAVKPSDSREAIASRVQLHRDRQRRKSDTATDSCNALQAVTCNATEQEQSEIKSEKRARELIASRVECISRDEHDQSELPPAALELLTHIRSAVQGEAASQMHEVLNGGTTYRGGKVQATRDRLDAKCRETLNKLAHGQLRNPWAYTLAKLADISDDSPTERASAAEKRIEQAEQAEERASFVEASEWIRSHPAVEREIRERLGDPAQLTYGVLFTYEVIRAFRQRHDVSGGITSVALPQ